jgi:hypothetical protein
MPDPLFEGLHGGQQVRIYAAMSGRFHDVDLFLVRPRPENKKSPTSGGAS